MDWKHYTKSRLIAKHPSGFYVIKPEDYDPGDPIFCPLCERIMNASFDEEAYKKFQCCDTCASFWAHPNKDKWLQGWRPTSEEVVNKYKVNHN